MEDGVWRTIGGRRVFIKNGEDLETAMKRSGKFKTKKEEKKEEKDEDKKNTKQGRSTRKEVSDKIKEHILEYYDDEEDFLEQMEAMNFGNNATPWQWGQEIAKGGSYLIYNEDMNEFLNGLEINPKGKKFNDEQIFNNYTSLVGRESAKLYEEIRTRKGKEIKDKILSFSNEKYSDGTYNIETGEKIDFKGKGFNVSFQQSTDNYSDAEYYDKIRECKKKGDGNIYAGKFGGDPEVSFYTESKDKAKEIMYKYNQHSIWSNELQDIIKNEKYDEKKNKTGYKDKE